MKNGEKPVANPFVMLREEFDDWAVLFNPDTGRGFGLSPTGVYVWKLFNGKQTLDHMIEEIRNHAEDVPRKVGDSLKAFLDELVEEGLVGVHQDDRISPVPQSGKYSSSIGIAMQVKTFKYEPPHLIDLSGAGRARGACAYNYCCTSGTNPSGGTNTCFTGGCAGRQCWGGLAPGSRCDCGTSPGFHNCIDGANECCETCSAGDNHSSQSNCGVCTG